ncbi:MAG: AAA family ATPase, partial [Rhodoferax sp.]|nr:AAA family ATPase [Rhodoferax sp.]
VVSDKASYTRQVGFDRIQQEQMVLSYIRQHGQIKRSEVMDLCRLSEGQAKDLLRRLMAAERISLSGRGRSALYLENTNPPQA